MRARGSRITLDLKHARLGLSRIDQLFYPYKQFYQLFTVWVFMAHKKQGYRFENDYERDDLNESLKNWGQALTLPARASWSCWWC